VVQVLDTSQSGEFCACICSLFNDAFQWLRLYCVEWKGDRWMMNWKGSGRKRSWPNLRHYLSICLEGLKKTTKTLNQGYLNPVPPEYEARMLTTRPRRFSWSVKKRADDEEECVTYCVCLDFFSCIKSQVFQPIWSLWLTGRNVVLNKAIVIQSQGCGLFMIHKL
jgi:hypothetical protein